jgi:tetratricopeptide (TPR) repeat protein
MQNRTRVLGALLTASVVACSGEVPASGPGDPPIEATPEFGAAVDVPPLAQAISFLGDTLLPVVLTDAQHEVYLARYTEAEDVLANDPEDADALVWMGRRTAYLGQFREAIDIYSHAMTLHPEDARLYRHRGHRYITVRELDNAIADFRRAAELTAGTPDEIEPDGLPNAAGIPTSTLQFNIWYHLGLSLYLKGDFEAALDAYRSCLSVSAHPDSVVATTHWLYMTLRRLGRDAEAAVVLEGVRADAGIVESGGYLDLLLLYKGERTAEELMGGDEITLASTTTSYGVGVYYLLSGMPDQAFETFEQTRAGIASHWGAFGFVAAEAELARR